LKFFPPDTIQADSPSARSYEGPRTVHGITEVLRELITDQFIHGFTKEEDLVSDGIQVVLFTEKAKPTLLYKSLAWRYHHLANFFEIKTKNQTLLDRFDITQFPALLVIKVCLLLSFESKE